MPGGVRVGRPNRIKHIPLSWDVDKARSNHEPKFRPVGDAILRGRERTVGQVMEEMFAAMPPVEPIIAGEMDVAAYFAGAMEVAEPFRVRIAEILQPTFNEGALLAQDRIRADINEQLRRAGSPLRLTDADGDVTKATANPQTVGGVRVGMSPKAEWATVGVEAFDSVNASSVQYAQFRSGTLVTAMVEEQQRVIQSVIGESFTAQQTFQTGRTVTGLTAQQTSQALVTVLQDVNPTTTVGQNLARFRGVNMNGLTKPWEQAVYHRAERMADALAKRGVTGVKAQMKIQKGAQAHANKLRRSRARMISRTEIKRAQVHGQLSAMRQAVSDGLADPKTAGKKWVTGATDVCNVCSDLGFGKAIPLDQSFEGVGDGPPAHPNCRCDLDFAHTISEAPRAIGAGDPKFPAGTPENPIVWQFPSGFQTKPSATAAFRPPGLTPPVPPPAAAATPAKPQAAPPEPMPANNPMPKARDYDPDGSIDQFPDFVSGRELSLSDDVISWPDAKGMDPVKNRKEWEASVERRLLSAKGEGDWPILRDGLYDLLEESGFVDSPITVNVLRDGRMSVSEGGHRLAVARELDLPIRVRWQGTGYKDLPDYKKISPVDGSDMKGSMSMNEVIQFKEKYPQTGGSYRDFVPPSRVGAPAKPGVPASNAEIVWDDAGRKWAQLTDDEQLFLFESHVDEIVREAYDDVLTTYVAKVDLPVSRPLLPDDASESIRAIYRQADRVDELKAQEATARVLRDDMGVVGRPGTAIEGRFIPDGWRDQFFTWADDTTEGFVAGEGNASFVRVKEAAEEGTRIPGSTRRLTIGEDLVLADPDGSIGLWDVLASMERLTPDLDSVPTSVLAKLETEITKLGTMIRTEATARTGGAQAAREGPVGWVSRKFKGAVATTDDVADLISSVNVLDEQYFAVRKELEDRIAAPLPRRPTGGRRPRFDTRSEELEYLAVWEPVEEALVEAVDTALRSVTDIFAGLDEKQAIDATLQNIRNGARARIRGALSPADEAVDALNEAIGALRTKFPEAWASRPAANNYALDLLGEAGPLTFRTHVSKRLAGETVRDTAEAHRHLATLTSEGFEEIADELADTIRLLWGDEHFAAELLIPQVDAATTSRVVDLAKVLSAGDHAGADRLLLGQLSHITADAAADLRATIGEVLREVRLVGGETFTFETGVQLPYHTGFKNITPRVREALDSMEEAVENWMPTDWIVRSNKRGKIGFNGEGQRAHYRDAGDGLINIGRTGSVPDQSVMLHEIMHRAQRATPLHSPLERGFVERRIAASPADKQVIRKLNEIKPGSGYDDWEMAVEDEFISPYIGKDYSQRLGAGGYLETTPMAVQELTGSQLAGGTSRALDLGDLDMSDWILGMLAGL